LAKSFSFKKKNHWQVLIINGAENGSQGWGFASNPVLNPVLYNPALAPGTRFDTLTATNIARVYHSTANLLPDGRILVAGSNSHEFYTFSPVFPTELRIEAFSPPYLAAGPRPAIVAAPGALGYGQNFVVEVEYAAVPRGDIELNLLTAPYVTHSYAQVRRRTHSVYTCVCMESGFPSPRPNCSCRAEHPSIKASNFFPSLGNCGHVLLWDVVYRDKGCCSSE
jgi:hypothetical protein